MEKIAQDAWEDTTIAIRLQGDLTKQNLDMQLDLVDDQVHKLIGPLALLVDATPMDSYQGDARARFVEWNKEHRADFCGVAVLTNKPMWRMVIGAMGLASGQKIKAFTDASEATAWLRAQKQAFLSDD